MHDLYEGIELSKGQTEWICRGLLDLAAVDGIHENEYALIGEFYASSGGDPGDLSSLEGKFDLKAAAAALSAGGEAAVEAFLISCYLLIYADGNHSDPERKRIGEYADAFGISAEGLSKLHLKARLYLLEMLAAGLRNKDAVREVAGAELGLSADEIAGSMTKED
ncbi:MAG: hypothetical protein KC620_17480 [Myxococcales bacterium]|nr:hypothetical protein [Myxococcales bacterium]